MSAENVAIVRCVYENFMAGDIPAVLGVLDPEVMWVEGTQDFLPHHGTHHGPDQVVAGVFMPTMASFDEIAFVTDRFHDAGDVVVVEGRVTGLTKAGGKLDAPAAWVWTVREGRIISTVNYHDSDAWRLALLG
ncbi:MAG: nuclear transport factor 2 family protein [Nocardioidaceae bacterium]